MGCPLFWTFKDMLVTSQVGSHSFVFAILYHASSTNIFLQLLFVTYFITSNFLRFITLFMSCNELKNLSKMADSFESK